MSMWSRLNLRGNCLGSMINIDPGWLSCMSGSLMNIGNSSRSISKIHSRIVNTLEGSGLSMKDSFADIPPRMLFD